MIKIIMFMVTMIITMIIMIIDDARSPLFNNQIEVHRPRLKYKEDLSKAPPKESGTFLVNIIIIIMTLIMMIVMMVVWCTPAIGIKCVVIQMKQILFFFFM